MMNEQSLMGAASLAGLNLFLANSVALMLPWVLTMTAVVVVDMLFGIRRCLLLGERVRFSKGVRRTLLKLMTYLPFVGLVSMIEIAAESENHVAKWCCLGICVVEGCSIVKNILTPLGYDFNVLELLFMLLRKRGIEGAEKVIKKKEN